MADKKIYIKNKKATHDFELIDTYTAGIVLTGTEVKSIRDSKANINDAFCYLHNNEMWVKGMHVSEYSFGSYNNHETKRERKLLLKKREIYKINEKLKIKGNTVIIKSLYVTPRGWVKVDIAVARGKKIFDKREDIKTKDAKRSMDRAMKNH